MSVREGERKGSWRVSVREEKSESEREEGVREGEKARQADERNKMTLNDNLKTLPRIELDGSR